MTDQIEQLLETAKARSGPKIHSELESITRRVQDLQAENEQLREEKESLQTELEKTTKGTLQLASELEQRYQRLFESAVEGIYTTTEDFDEYRMANPAFADLLGYESGDAVCEAIDSIEEEVFVNPDRYAEYAETLQAIGEVNQFEYQIRTADGETRWVSDSVRAITDDEGAIKGYRGGVIDITKEKKNERKLKQQSNLSIVLNRILRHNLRNDISIIRGFTQMMAEELDDDTYGEKALGTIDGLIELSEKARELDEIIAHDAEPTPTDIPDLINGVVAEVRRDYPSASISVEADGEITDEVRPSFKRAIRELIENAAKHSGDEPTVEVSVESESDEVHIHIADNGPGIEEQEAGVLRSGSEKPLMHGSGLGLWLAHWIVTNHDGLIDAILTDEGTMLTVIIPGTTQEIDQQQQIPELARARDHYKAGFEEAGDGMIITDDEARILEVNDEAARIFGVDRQELPGRSIQEFLPEEFEFEAAWGEMKADGIKRDQASVVNATGGTIPVEYTAKSDIVPGQHLIVFKDITERKEREQQVIRMKERYQTLLEAAPDPVIVANAETREIIEVSETAETLFEMPSDEIIGLAQSDLHPPDQAEFYRQLFEEHAQSGGTRRRLPDGSPIYIVTANGEHIPVEISVHTVSLPDGPVTYGIFRDIHEQVERERQIEHQKAKFQGVFEDSFDAMVLADDDGRYIDVNKSATELFGVSEDELLGRSIAEFAPEDFDFAEAWQEFKESEKQRGTFPLVRGDGDERIVEFAATRDIVPGKHLSILRDITDRKERERRYSAIFNQTYQFTGLLEPDGTVIEANETALNFGDINRENVIGKPLWETYWWSGDEASQQELREAIETAAEGEFVRYEVELQGGDETAIIDFSIRPITDDQGNVTELIPEGRDITERKQRERTLERFKKAVEHAGHAVYMTDPEGTIEYVNPAFEKITGFSAEEAVGENPRILKSGEMSEGYYEDLWEAVLDGDIWEEEIINRRRSGEKYYAQQTIAPIIDEDGEIDQFVAIQTDITERKEREEALQEKKDRLETIIELSPEPILAIDTSGTVTLWNEAAEDAFGYPAEEVIGEQVQSMPLLKGEQPSQFQNRFEQVLAGDTIRGIETERQRKDGTTMDLSISATPLRNASGSVTGLIAVAQDISELKERERELAEKTRQLEAIVQNTEEAIYIKDTAGYYQFINESGADLFDMSAEEVIGKHDEDLFDAESAADIRSEDEKVMESGQAVRKETVRYIDGEKHVFLDAKYPYRDDEGEVIGLIGISPDVTERKEHEWKLQRQNERLDEFASVISHDLRNPLNVAQGRIELAQEEYDSEHLGAAANGVERSLKLIENLLTLARGGKEIGEMEPVEMTDLVQTCWNYVETGDARVVTDLESTIQADRSRLRQLLENLFRNAVDHGGEDVTIRVGSLPDGFYVEDNGPGIPQEKRESVFEPSYSESGGSRFGLSIVKQIVDAHEWDIRITEGSEGGARFEITGVDFTAE